MLFNYLQSRTPFYVQLGTLSSYFNLDHCHHIHLYLLIAFHPSPKSLTHTFEIHWKKSSPIRTYLLKATVSTLSEGQGQPWPLTTKFHFKTFRPMAFGAVQQYGHISRMHLLPRPSSLQPFKPWFLPGLMGLVLLKLENFSNFKML